MLRLDIAYLCTKFDEYDFSRSRDMVVAHQNLNGLRDQTTPLSGMICHPWVSTYDDQPPYQKAIQNIENGVVWGYLGVTQGH